MKVDKSKGSAPNKPVLLLAIIDSYKNGYQADNQIDISPELVGIFREIWNKLVEESRDRKFSLPFFHLKTSPFWSLVPNRGYELAINSIPTINSLSKLQEIVHSAKLDKEFVELLNVEKSRDVIVQFILDKYFPDSQSNYYNSITQPYANIQLEIDPAIYKAEILELREIADKNEFQEEIYVRSGAFKRMILQNYNDTCAISGMRISATANISILDACHIIPFAESYDDTPGNGIALTPTLHRAFDRGLISISDNYKVILNKNFKEEENSPYRLRQFEGLVIRLPKNLSFAPGIDNLQAHRRLFQIQT